MASQDADTHDAEVAEEDENAGVPDLPCTLDGVEVQPRELHTRLHLILREFKHAREAGTLKEVAIRTEQALDSLRDLGVFHDVEAVLSPGDAVRHRLLCALEPCSGLANGPLPTLTARPPSLCVYTVVRAAFVKARSLDLH
jgi:hypothetical protein